MVERPELVSLPDHELLARMAAERRAIVTNHVSDLLKLFGETLGDTCSGLLLIDERSMPRSRGTIGLYVRVLAELLAASPFEDALRNQLRWLP